MPQIYIAAAAVRAEQDFELSLLARAQAAASTPFMDFLPALWAANNVARDAFDAAQMRNATCLCGTNATAALDGTARFTNATHYVANNCTGRAVGAAHVVLRATRVVRLVTCRRV